MTNPEPGATTSPNLALAFAPIHKLALGVSAGTVLGLLLFALTLINVQIGPQAGANLGLLSQYFYGYEVTPAGALVGLFWGFLTGFVIGWFAAFVRNFAIGFTIFALRTKAELSQTKDFLDHI
jgi:hypothetical protein